MAALETVTILHERSKAPREVRISRNVRRAIDVMVFEGAKRSVAAQTAGITDGALQLAMRKPEVLAYMNTQQGVLRTSAAARSVARVDILADEAGSDSVKLDANKWLAGLQGIAPIQRSESITHLVHHQPGLVVMRTAEPSVPLIADQVIEGEIVSDNSGLPKRVPHPSEANAMENGQIPVEKPASRRGGGRAKR